MKMTSEIRAIDKLYKRRDRYEIPEWQRDEVWTKLKKQKLIDSMLRGWRLPKFYFVRTSESPDVFEVVDGQQRISAIFEFLDNELELLPATASEFGGGIYDDLNDEISDAFDDFEIQYDQIEDADEHEIKEFFLRLQDGLPLTASEKLNAVHSNLRDFCAGIAKHNFFVNTVRLTDKRYSHFDILTKVAVIEVEGIGVGLRLEDVTKVFEGQSKFSDDSAVARRIRAALSLLEKSFETDCNIFRNRALIQSFLTLACKIILHEPETKELPQLAAFGGYFYHELSKQVEMGHGASDVDYAAFQKTINANIKSGSKIRHEILMRKLLKFDPSMADLFTHESLLASGIDQQIQHQAESIAQLITRVNDVYSAKYGKDLFKATTKTIDAVRVMRIPVKNCAQWKGFVESLYYLFREGPGSKLSGEWPTSFVHVNDLRVGDHHDLDHGNARKASKKRVTISQTFQEYSGAVSPDVVSPDRFPATQSKLLDAIEVDVRRLLAKYT